MNTEQMKRSHWKSYKASNKFKLQTWGLQLCPNTC